MTVRRHGTTTALMAVLTCALVIVVGAARRGGCRARARHGRDRGDGAGRAFCGSSGGVGLSIPRPTGRHPVGVRSTFVRDPARTEPRTGGPRAIPARVWYPARHRHGPSASYFSAPVQAFIEEGLGGSVCPCRTACSTSIPTRRLPRPRAGTCAVCCCSWAGSASRPRSTLAWSASWPRADTRSWRLTLRTRPSSSNSPTGR